MGKYDDIIGLRYEGSVTRRRMSMGGRAAQFAPFAALNGHDSAISETARLTSEKIELSEDAEQMLSQRLSYALQHMADNADLTFVVFRADERKKGGRYMQVSGVIKKYDEYERVIHLTSGQAVRVDDIISIEGEQSGM